MIKLVKRANEQATPVIKMPSKTPLYWYAHGIVTVPQPIIAFQVLKIIISEDSFWFPSFGSSWLEQPEQK